ncbi:MAG: hypothetical protein F4W90_10545 [Gammaproteobacteria bacterium]|nr:hypothetical protein [Gammaproteobacteria bacterium]
MATSEAAIARTVFGAVNDPRARTLASQLDAELRPCSQAPASWHVVYKLDELQLVAPDGALFKLEEDEIEQRLVGFSRSALVKACAAQRKPRILDALSGWGTDGLALAAFGCKVVCCELHPLVAMMNHARALRMNVDVDCKHVDAMDYMRACEGEFDVVYLDAMFPAHPKGALPMKSMQVLAQLAVTCDLEMMLAQARQVATDRVVVKQRRKYGTNLPKPSWTIEGKTIRFDVYQAAAN